MDKSEDMNELKTDFIPEIGDHLMVKRSDNTWRKISSVDEIS